MKELMTEGDLCGFGDTRMLCVREMPHAGKSTQIEETGI